jgi:hypothetical protein
MGTSNNASQQAAAADAARQAQIQSTVSQITQAYSSPERTKQYEDYGRNLTNYYTGQVKEQEGTNARNLKFSLARSGLTGGSAAVDANTQLQKDYSKGLLYASQQAQTGRAALESSDINAKNQLISLAQQGNYTGAIPQQVSEAQRAALGSAQASFNPAALGDLFKSTAEIYKTQETNAANRRAAMNPIGSVYGASAYSGAGKWG